MRRLLNRFISLFALLILSGCMGYQLGGTKPTGIKTVFMAPIVNETTEPAIELQIEHALRSRIQFDGRLKLKGQKEADALLEVTLTNYKLTAITFQNDLQTTAKEYRIRLDAKATLTNRITGERISEAQNYGETTFEFASDLTSSKRSAARKTADDLAKYLIDDLIEQW